MAQGLIDLEELTRKCWDERTREHISEAVSCYHGGAYRACIVSTWTAVVYDILFKLQDLSDSGDPNAKTHVEDFNRKRSSVSDALEFERNILDVVKHEFEFLTELEYVDLCRLRDDRNRCAHPTMNNSEDTYRASAELARCHLTNAVQHLLQHQPQQGPSALNRLHREVDSPYFPKNVPGALARLQAGPLLRPRESLVRQFVASTLKELLIVESEPDRIARLQTALNAVHQLHTRITEMVVASKIDSLFSRVQDNELHRAIIFLRGVPFAWSFLPFSVRERVEAYIANMPEGDIKEYLVVALDIEQLRAKAQIRISTLESSDLADLIKKYPRDDFINVAIDQYATSTCWFDANWKSKSLIMPLAERFTEEQVTRLIQTASGNSEVTNSFEFPTIIQRWRSKNTVPNDRLDQLLIENDLTDFIESPSVDPSELDTENPGVSAFDEIDFGNPFDN